MSCRCCRTRFVHEERIPLHGALAFPPRYGSCVLLRPALSGRCRTSTAAGENMRHFFIRCKPFQEGAPALISIERLRLRCEKFLPHKMIPSGEQLFAFDFAISTLRPHPIPGPADGAVNPPACRDPNQTMTPSLSSPGFGRTATSRRSQEFTNEFRAHCRVQMDGPP